MQAYRLDAFDGLRGIAIGLVVWYHLWQVSWLDPHVAAGSFYLPLISIPVSGFLGVELFFFISAFCLSYPYVRAHFAARPLPGLRHFAYRRFIKIVPSYVLSIVAVVALAGLPGTHLSFGANLDWTSPGKALFDLAAHLAFLHTYFYDTYASINGVLWTLGIEVQFYVLFPLLVLLLLRAPLSTAAIMIAIGMTYRTAIGECCRTPVFDHNLDQLLGFFDYFALGMLCAYAFEWVRLRKPRAVEMRWLWTLVALAGFAAILLLFRNLESLRRDDHFAEWWVIRNAIWYAVAIFAAAFGSLFAWPAWRTVLANPVLVFLSTISYNLYLWHQVLMRWVATLPFPHATANPREDPAWEWFAALTGLAVSIAVATLVTYGFERPLLRTAPSELAARLRRIARRETAVPAPSPEQP